MKLIYHKTDYNSDDISAFDRELTTLASGQNLHLVSPYIGIKYLKRLIKISKTWRLITDIEEWIISHPNKIQRLELCDFISSHFENIRHIPEIHAKVLVTENSAFLGSANFTENGICVRTEMSVSFSEQEKVEELKNWFQSLWRVASSFTKNQLIDFVKRNENINLQPKISKLNAFLPKQKRKWNLAPLDTFFKTEKDYELELIKAIKKSKKDKIWLNKYFDLVKDILSEFNIDVDSPKITMSITQNFKMPISIGQRYVIELERNGNSIGLILPLEFSEVISDFPDARISEGYFYTNKVKQAHWIRFDSETIFSKNQVLLDSWKKAVKHEIDRTMISGFRKSHNPFYYKAVMDLEYRNRILNE